MRTALTALFSVLVVISSLAASMGFGPQWQRFMPSSLGDARMGFDRTAHTITNLEFHVPVLTGSHTGLTVTVWSRLTTGTSYAITNTEVGVRLLYAPEAIRRSNPSLAFADAQGWPTNMLLAGSVSKDPFPFAPYGPGTSSNTWPKGVYTVAGWSSNAVTVSVGGNSVTLGPGEFNRNVIGGSGSACTVTGSGLANIGVSRCPDAEFFILDGVEMIDGGMFFRPQCVLSNEIKFVSVRLCLSETSHKGCVSYYNVTGIPFVVTNELVMPRAARALDSTGIYRLVFHGVLKQQKAYDVDFFDFRVFPRVLSDDELLRIRDNGADEIARRGIPRWR